MREQRDAADRADRDGTCGSGLRLRTPEKSALGAETARDRAAGGEPTA